MAAVLVWLAATAVPSQAAGNGMHCHNGGDPSQTYSYCTVTSANPTITKINYFHGNTLVKRVQGGPGTSYSTPKAIFSASWYHLYGKVSIFTADGDLVQRLSVDVTGDNDENNLGAYPSFSDAPTTSGATPVPVASGPTAPKSWAKAWSKKRSGYATTSKVGRTNAVTTTTLSKRGKAKKAMVSYQWFVGGKLAKKGSTAAARAYRPVASQAGKTLVLKALISKAGYRSRIKSISYGQIAPAFTPHLGEWILSKGSATNYDLCGDAEQSIAFTVNSNRTVTVSQAAGIDTNSTKPVYVDGNSATLPISATNEVHGTLTGLHALTCTGGSSNAATLKVDVQFSSATKVSGSILIADASLAPSGAPTTFAVADGGYYTS
ncbi:hypothetical protein [Nocardioides sp. Root140]|uniref:hypothetical protein n=1 Tax=Nocardioides sp. Root140 TaxID=1736460 RepID=UPI001F394880|nr:hypothetical protein [Nocardioides sp. Root140]